MKWDLLISHHPLLIDELALSAGYWFDREDENTKVRVTRLTEKETLGLQASMMVATDSINA